MTAVAGPLGIEIEDAPPASAAHLFWVRFKEDKAALVALGVIIVLVLIAFFGGPLAAHFTGHPQNSVYTSATNDFGVPLGPRLHSPDGAAIFGWDPAGRDLFVRTMYGHAHLADRRHRRDGDRRPHRPHRRPDRGLLRRLGRHRPVAHLRRHARACPSSSSRSASSPRAARARTAASAGSSNQG